MSDSQTSSSEGSGSESDDSLRSSSQSSGSSCLEEDGETRVRIHGRYRENNSQAYRQIIRAGDQEYNLANRGEPCTIPQQSNTGNYEPPQSVIHLQLIAGAIRRLLNSEGVRHFRVAVRQRLTIPVAQGQFNYLLPSVYQISVGDEFVLFLREVCQQSNAGEFFGQFIRALVPRLNVDEFDELLSRVFQVSYQYIDRQHYHLPTQVIDSENDQQGSFNNSQSFRDLFRGPPRRCLCNSNNWPVDEREREQLAGEGANHEAATCFHCGINYRAVGLREGGRERCCLHNCPYKIVRMAYFGTLIMTIVDITITAIIIISVIIAGIFSLL